MASRVGFKQASKHQEGPVNEITWKIIRLHRNTNDNNNNNIAAAFFMLTLVMVLRGLWGDEAVAESSPRSRPVCVRTLCAGAHMR